MKQRREEDKCIIKRIYYRYEPYINIGSLVAMMPVLYFCISFYITTSDTNASVPAMKKQMIEAEKNMALLNQKVDLMLDFWRVPGRDSIQ